jgi:tetratricopeptide (TPR) repeat protein
MNNSALSLRSLRLLALVVLAASGSALANNLDCGDPFTNHFGPFDYRTARPEDKKLVESFHFKPETEQLRAGSGTGYAGGDIAYTLHVFPNHPRALVAMSRLALREKSARAKHAAYSVDCYFDRAMRFAPDDPNVYVTFGVYLQNVGKATDAAAQLRKAVELDPRNANAHYNLGLAYFSLKDYPKSLAHAHEAYGLGFPLPGLRKKLESVGKWQPGAAASGKSG